MVQNVKPNYQKTAVLNSNRAANQQINSAADNQESTKQSPYNCQPNQGFQCGMIGNNEVCVRNPIYSQSNQQQ